MHKLNKNIDDSSKEVDKLLEEADMRVDNDRIHAINTQSEAKCVMSKTSKMLLKRIKYI